MEKGKNLPQDLVEQPEIRRVYDKETSTWYYSVIDAIAALTDTPDPTDYWTKLKRRVKKESFEIILQRVVQFKLQARDNRFRLTDCVERETLLRLVQSIPSSNKKVEAFKLWLAQVGEERIEEWEDPEAAIEKVRERYRRLGRSEEWITRRLEVDFIRNELTDEWSRRGAKIGLQFATLTDTIHRGTFAISIQQHKQIKNLSERANLRDHSDELELALTGVGEATALLRHRERNSQGYDQLLDDAEKGGEVGRAARLAAEKAIGRSAINPKNFLKGEKPQCSIPKSTQSTLFDETEQ